MGHGDDIIAAITRIHAPGLDATKWPDALAGVTNLIGGHGASLEFIERPSLRHHGMYSYGLPAVGAYLEYYAPMCPRLPYTARQPAGSILYDAQYCDEDAMNANPFYAEFLAAYDMRYFLGGVVACSPHDFVLTGVQTSPKRGHPTPAKIKLMAVLLPHIQQATDVMRRLGDLTKTQSAFQHTLDWLVDGVVMLAADGAVRYANVAAQTIFRANDGIAVRRGVLKLASADATTKLGESLKAVCRLRDSEAAGEAHQDFIVSRRSGATAYSISVRPLLAAADKAMDAVALIFIRDPLTRRQSSTKLLGQMFGLTAAEAALANALCSGFSPDEFARESNISSNTVYTHIRHLKEKTGSSRMAELIRKLNNVQASVVAEQK